MIPEKIDRYEIKGELGRGGMATVYYAYDPRFKRDVAVKVLPSELLHNPTFRARFEREAQTIASLEYPAIVPVYDFGEEAGQPYLVMRFMPGGSLDGRLRRGPLSVAEAARLIARLALPLDEAHAHGVIHRDLKPDNILFDQNGDPYISDFGIAKLTEAGANLTSNTIIGTPAYMSPEQARGEGKLDGRSDIYALGVILFEVLTGKHPYDSDTPMGLALKHITEPVPSILAANPHLPPGCERMIARAMAKQPEARFATAKEMAAALAEVASRDAAQTDEKTILLPPEDRALPLTPQLERRRRISVWGWIGIAGGVIALGLLCALLGRGVLASRLSPMATPTSTTTSSVPNHTLSPVLIPGPTTTPATPSASIPGATVVPASSPTPTPSKTTTATPSATLTPTFTPSKTSPPSATVALSHTPTLTSAFAPSNTPTATATSTGTSTPTETSTPTPADTQGPIVAAIDANPRTVKSKACNVTFQANITDPSGVATASVVWTAFDKNGVPFGSGPGSAGMGIMAGDIWAVSFNLLLPNRGYLDWSVQASDTIGNTTTQASGITINAQGPCQ